jgi:hypothetical protein
MTLPKYSIDIATSYFSGRTEEIEADNAQQAYEQVKNKLKEGQKIIQIRDEWNALLYTHWDEQGFVVKVKDK